MKSDSSNHEFHNGRSIQCKKHDAIDGGSSEATTGDDCVGGGDDAVVVVVVVVKDRPILVNRKATVVLVVFEDGAGMPTVASCS